MPVRTADRTVQRQESGKSEANTGEDRLAADHRILTTGQALHSCHEARSFSMKLAIINARPVQATNGTSICLDAANLSESSLPEK
jgi:hypothetical protein